MIIVDDKDLVERILLNSDVAMLGWYFGQFTIYRDREHFEFYLEIHKDYYNFKDNYYIPFRYKRYSVVVGKV